MTSVTVLGAGRVGAAMARDLARDETLAVTAVDSNPGVLRALEEQARADGTAIRTRVADLGDAGQLEPALDGQDLVIGAVPGPMGFETLHRVLSAGVDTVDISFFEEDPFELDQLARRNGCVAIVDAGVAPGLSNLILGDLEARLVRTRSFECLVGGVPADPSPPWHYQAPFSPIDVLAEYTRPARLRRAGREVTVPALSEVEVVEFPGVGRLEAFNTDGLRTLLSTSDAPDLVEKTLRWPGHADTMRLLRETGFLSEEPLETPAGPVAPLAITSRLLFDAWRYEPGQADLTAMRVTVEGDDADGPIRHTVRLVDRHDPETGVSSMARTTGYTATALAHLVLDGHYREPGISPPERVGALDGALDAVIDHLRERGVEIEWGTTRP